MQTVTSQTGAEQSRVEPATFADSLEAYGISMT
jgi:hypothetical protein